MSKKTVSNELEILVNQIRQLIEKRRKASFNLWDKLYELEERPDLWKNGALTFRRYTKQEFGLDTKRNYEDYSYLRRMGLSNKDLTSVGEPAIMKVSEIVRAQPKETQEKVLVDLYNSVKEHIEAWKENTRRHPGSDTQRKVVLDRARSLGLEIPEEVKEVSWKDRCEALRAGLDTIITIAAEGGVLDANTIGKLASASLKRAGFSTPKVGPLENRMKSVVVSPN
jgi:hypothetical protein